jgi:hypothetical protein
MASAGQVPCSAASGFGACDAVQLLRELFWKDL